LRQQRSALLLLLLLLPAALALALLQAAFQKRACGSGSCCPSWSRRLGRHAEAVRLQQQQVSAMDGCAHAILKYWQV
jgi:hypothetical protein